MPFCRPLPGKPTSRRFPHTFLAGRGRQRSTFAESGKGAHVRRLLVRPVNRPQRRALRAPQTPRILRAWSVGLLRQNRRLRVVPVRHSEPESLDY